MCHGVDVVSGGLNPDLRYSKLLDDDGWYDVVLGGKFKDQGMVSFAKNINKQQATAIRAFVIQRAIDSEGSRNQSKRRTERHHCARRFLRSSNSSRVRGQS